MENNLKNTTSFGVRIQVATLLAAVLMVSGGAHAVDLAKVNGKVITEKDIQNALSGLNEGQRKNVLKDTNSRRQVLANVIDQEILVQEGEKEKLDQDQDYKDALNGFRRQYLASKVLQKNLGPKVTDSAAKKFYETHQLRYSTEQVHALHILVKEEAQARDLFTKAKAMNPEDFQALAEKVSVDPSAKNNRGDLGFFGRDRMVPEFANAAFSGSEGEVVGPVKTAFGYHVIKILTKRSGKPVQYDEVELRVKNDLRNDLTQGYVGNLKKQAKVEVDDKAVDKL
ncbi:peptidylprolyl isomerase [Bdellovibrionota bacterium FG-1]